MSGPLRIVFWYGCSLVLNWTAKAIWGPGSEFSFRVLVGLAIECAAAFVFVSGVIVPLHRMLNEGFSRAATGVRWCLARLGIIRVLRKLI